MKLRKKRTISKANKEFISTNSECIGIDITRQAIYTVLLNARSVNQIRLEKYAITPLPPHIFNDSGIEDHDQLVAYLQQAVKQLGSSCKNITTAMPQNLVSLQTLHYHSQQTELSLEEFVEFEISQTASLDDSSYDYFILQQSGSNHQQDILLANCNREDLNARLDVFSAANITPKQMDVDVLAVMNAVNLWIGTAQAELAEQSLAVFHLGHRGTAALITQNDRLLYKQEINLGHEHLMQIVRRNYQLTEEEAWAMVYATEKPADFASKAGSLFQDQLAQEIQRFLQFYYTASNHDQGSDVQHIVICGYPGNPSNPTLGIAERVSRQVNIPTQQISPITAAQANPRLDNEQLLNDGNLLTVAFGLAARGL